MTLSEDIDRLSRVQLFDGFPAEQLRLLAFGSRRLFFRAGEILFDADSLSDGGFVIFTGQVDLIVQKGKREAVLASYLENSLVGEMALITANRRFATAVARTNCEALHIPRELFTRMLSEYPDLAGRLHQRIAASVNHLLGEMAQVQGRMHSIPDLTIPNQTDQSERQSADVETGDDGNMV